MGNVLAQPVRVSVDPLADLPGVVLKDTLGGGRFLRTLLCLHDSGGLVVVKIYFKRPDTAATGLEVYKQQLAAVRSALSVPSCQHAWPWQTWVESQHVGYLVRQHLAQNLYDRLSTRPFLSKLEKRWIAFQLLVAASQIHACKVVHGDIKSENVLLTSWEWIFLADFAAGLKPVALPADNPAEYSFFFDTGGRRRAYIAPERFFTAGSAADSRAPAALTPEMDIFSLGCVIAEVFCDGKALFDLSELLSYRRGDAAADPATNGALAAVDPDVRRLVLHMIQLDPAARWSAARYLTHWPEPLFPPYFSSVLHPFFASLLSLDADARVAATAAAFPRLRREILAAGAAAAAAAAEGSSSGAGGGAGKGAVAAATASSVPGHVRSAGSSTTGMIAATPSGAPASASPAAASGPSSAGTREPSSSATPPASGAAAATDGGAAAAAGGAAAAGVSGPGGGPPGVMAAMGGGPGGVLGGGGGGPAGLGSLLDEVGALLAESGSMARRLKPPGDGDAGPMLGSPSGSEGGDEAFLLDGELHDDTPEGEQAGASASSGPNSASAFTGMGAGVGTGGALAAGDHSSGPHHQGASVIEEVVTEEVYEHQVREPWGNWQGASEDDDGALVGGALGGMAGGGALGARNAGGPAGASGGAGGGRAAGGGGGGGGSAWRGREEVELPEEGGWQWAGEWAVDMRGGQHAGPGGAPAVDAEGWEYRSAAGGPGGHRTWASLPDATCTSRRRRWVRQRRRRLPAPLPSASGGAVPGGPPLGRMPSSRSSGPVIAGNPGAGAGAAAAAAGASAATAAASSAIGTAAGGAAPGRDGGGPGGALSQRAAGAPAGAAGAAGAGQLLEGTGLLAGPAGGAAAGAAAGGGGGPSATHAGQGLVLVAVLLCSTLRGSRLQESRLAALRLLVASAEECDDYVRLQCVVPYLLTALHDLSAAVRCMAVRGIVRTLSGVQALPPADVKVFQDYVLPSMSLIPNDPEEAVRVEYGMGLAYLAAAAHRHLLRLQNDNNMAAAAAAAAAVAATGVAPGLAPPPIRYDSEVAAVRGLIERGVVELVTGLRSSVDVKRALLSHVSLLAEAFGRRGVTELLLPLLITCLNAPEGRLRGAFFRAVGSLGPEHLGGEALDAFLLPCLEQALTDQEPQVVYDAVQCLVSVTCQLRKRSLLSAADKVAPLLRHGSPAVRGAAVALVAAAARDLPPADVYAQLAVLVAPYIQKLPPLLSDPRLLAGCLEHPGRRQGPGEGREGDEGGGLAGQCTSGGKAYGSAASGGVLYSRSGSGKTAGAQAETLAAAMDRLSAPLRSGGNATGAGGHSLASGSREGAARGLAGAGGDPGAVLPAGLPLLDGLVGSDDAADLILRPAAPLYTYDMTLDPTAAAAAALAAGGADAVTGAAAAAVAAAAAAVGAACPSPVSSAAAALAAASAALAAATTPGPGLSAHSAALATLPGRLASLESRVAALAERVAREPLGLDPLERQQLDRLAILLSRLRADGGSDVRDGAARDTWRLVCLSQRGPPPLGTHGSVVAGGGGGMGPSGGGSGLHGALQLGDYFTVAGGPSAPDYYAGGGGGWGEAPGSAASPSGGGGWWRPRGVLVAHLAEHRRGVTRLAVGAGGCFLASASNDETVKVWDLRRMERDVSFHSRLTYAAQSGRITALCCCGGGADGPPAYTTTSSAPAPWSSGTTVASGSSSGSLHLWRPEYTTRQGGVPDKYTGVVAVRQLSPGQGTILEVAAWGPHLLLYVTQRGGLAAWDTRTRLDAWALPCAPARGLPEHLIADPAPAGTWLMTGSSRGYLSLWDVRFQQCVHTWQHPLRCSIDAMALATGPPARVPPQGAAHPHGPGLGAGGGGRPQPPGASGCPLVWVAAGQGEAGLWDIVSGRCRQVLRCLGPVEAEAAAAVTTPAALMPPQPQAPSGPQSQQQQPAVGLGAGGAGGSGGAAASLGVEAVSQPQPRTAGARCLLSLPGGALLWGGSDAAVRYWDAARPEGSYAVCGPLWPGDSLSDGTQLAGLSVPEYRYKYRTRVVSEVAVCEELCVLDNSSRLTESCHELRGRVRVNDQAHADSVTALAVADPPGSSRLLLSASRDGVVKAWK